MGRIEAGKDIAKNIQKSYTYDDMCRVRNCRSADLNTGIITYQSFSFDADGNMTDAFLNEQNINFVFNPAPTNFSKYGLDMDKYTADMKTYIVEHEIVNTFTGFISDSGSGAIPLPSEELPFSIYENFDLTTRIINGISRHSMATVIKALGGEL